MATFQSALGTTLLLFTFLLIGYVLRKKELLPRAADTVLSRLENMIFVPAVVISTFMARFTADNIGRRGSYILVSCIVALVTLPLALAVGRLLGKDEAEERIFRYSAMIPNFSFFGIPLVSGTLGEEALFDYLIFCIPMYVICYSIGVVWLIPSENGAKVSLKSFANPICISVLIGMVLGLIGVRLPGFLDTALSQASGCMGPVAMILTGFVVAGYGIRNLLGDSRIYIMAALRLLIIPFVVTMAFRLVLKDSPVLLYVLCFLAMPLGLNTIVIPAAYGGDTRIGASCALISSVLAVVTIPVLFLVFGF
ncbi:MAG: AEC family transporter [Lachnospiraceae bacterium]|nr:AEC family transporter [Lachnospiraceae bacterium]